MRVLGFWPLESAALLLSLPGLDDSGSLPFKARHSEVEWPRAPCSSQAFLCWVRVLLSDSDDGGLELVLGGDAAERERDVRAEEQ